MRLRVKCDESKPKCRNCVDYGLECGYGIDAHSLTAPVASHHPHLEDCSALDTSQSQSHRQAEDCDRFKYPPAVCTYPTTSSWLDRDVCDALDGFQSRTLLGLCSFVANPRHKAEFLRLTYSVS